MTELNHHSTGLLPYHINSQGSLEFVLEQKDPDFKKPYFDNGLNFLGGNWMKKDHEDKSPKETLIREIKEEKT